MWPESARAYDRSILHLQLRAIGAAHCPEEGKPIANKKTWYSQHTVNIFMLGPDQPIPQRWASSPDSSRVLRINLTPEP
jgi:cytochrome c551/c552